MPSLMLLNSTFSVTRVIIVALTHTDREMFVSHDHNYNHSRILKLNSVVFEWPVFSNQFTILFCIFPPRFTDESNCNFKGAIFYLTTNWLTQLIGCTLLSWSFSWLVSGCVVMMPTAARDWWGPTQAVRMSSGLWSCPHGGKLIYL